MIIFSEVKEANKIGSSQGTYVHWVQVPTIYLVLQNFLPTKH